MALPLYRDVSYLINCSSDSIIAKSWYACKVAFHTKTNFMDYIKNNIISSNYLLKEKIVSLSGYNNIFIDLFVL